VSVSGGARTVDAGVAAPVRLVFGGVAVAVVAMAVLHVLGVGRLDPATTTVSDYVSLPGGAVLLSAAVLAVALAAALVPVALARAGLRDPAPPTALFALGCAGLVGSVVFPTNAVGTPGDLDTVLHRYAAGLFFVALPLAALAVRRRLDRPGAALGWLIAASVATGCVFLASHLPLVFPDAPGHALVAEILPRGYAERLTLVTDLALLWCLGSVGGRAVAG
jgi:Protein of unknown function (DUF998)